MPMPRRPIIPLTSKTHHRLLDLLDYDDETGHFTWRKTRGGLAHAGTRAGTESGCGYRHLRVMRQTFKEHRLAWFYIHGRWPDIDLDHIDGNKHNNAIGNLRLATSAQNVANSNVRKDSQTGLKGVRLAGGCTRRWIARITENGVRRIIGRYNSPDEAYAAYRAAAALHFGEYTRV